MSNILQTISIMMMLTSCEQMQTALQDVNYAVFSNFGSIIGKKPPEISLKQVHLSREDYFLRDIFVSGKVIELADERTFAIIDDGDGTLLIKLTYLPVEVADKIKESQKIRIFGKLEYGKLGMPILTAHGIFSIKAKA